MIPPQFNDSSPAQTSDGSSVITTKIIEIEPLVYFKPLTAFIGLFMGELLAKTWLFLADSGKIPRIDIIKRLKSTHNHFTPRAETEQQTFILGNITIVRYIA